MKKRNKLFFPALAAALIFFTAGFFWWHWSTSPVSKQETAFSKIFVVKKGESLSSIAVRLKKEGLVKDPFAFKILVLVKGLSGKIQAGGFRLDPSLTPEKIARLLAYGTLDIWLTFPEGWRREEFGRRLTANLENFDYQEFVKLTESLEGYLFPDTYLIPKDATPSAVVGILTNNFEKKFTSVLENEAKKEGLTKRQALVLASVVERESRYGEDRPIVAGILLKRWRNNWPLQADATVQYAKATINYQTNWWPEKLTRGDLQIDSPYNTYQYKGLPPTPICNPGLASIEAVLNSHQTAYWFYLSDKEGKIHYAKTKEEHSQNILRYLR